MNVSRAAWAALFMLSLFMPASGQGAEGAVTERPSWQLEPDRERSAAWLLALWGVSPYAEMQAAGLPLPPSPADVEKLSAATRLQEQKALKEVWLERLIRAREERNRVSRENLAHSLLQARQAGAPAAFVEILRRQVSDALPYRERHMLDAARQELLTSYGVDARELRFFVEASGLSAEQLRDVAVWLPLPALFNLPAAAEPEYSPLAPAEELAADYAQLLAVRRELAEALQGVVDSASADAAAEALLPVLVRYLTALESFLLAPEERRMEVMSAAAAEAAPVNEACEREGKRLREAGWFDSHRLQALDYLFH